MSKYRIYRFPLPNDRLQLIEKIERMMSVPKVRAYRVFESQSFLNSNYDLYTNYGFHLNIANGGIHNESPHHILDIMRSPDCEHLIWISREVCEADDPIHFSWIYAHELEHMNISIQDYELTTWGAFLVWHYPSIREVYNVDVPTEHLCEEKAMHIATKIFGQEMTNRYMHDSPDIDMDYFMKKIEYFTNRNYREETAKILCAHKREFQRMQDEDHSVSGKHKIDFEKLCS